MNNQSKEINSIFTQKQFICIYHREIIDRCKVKLKNKNLLEEEIVWLKEIIEISKLALKAGKTMESRLMVYKSGIEDLGFTRIYPKKEKNKEKKEI